MTQLLRLLLLFLAIGIEWPHNRECGFESGDCIIPRQIGSKISVRPRSGISRPKT